MWRSPVAHTPGGRGVAGSNPVIPTTDNEGVTIYFVTPFVVLDGRWLDGLRWTGAFVLLLIIFVSTLLSLGASAPTFPNYNTKNCAATVENSTFCGFRAARLFVVVK